MSHVNAVSKTANSNTECHVFEHHATIVPTNEPSREKTNNVIPNRSDTNRAVQIQKQARSLKFRI